MKAMKVLLERGEKVLVYAEQGMWWNYRKPRPLTVGAFKFAVESKVPVLPIFITMEDSDLIDGDGFPVQKYTVNILPAIFADPSKNTKENMEEMKIKNYEAWVKVYEDFYKTPLVYSTEKPESTQSGAAD